MKIYLIGILLSLMFLNESEANVVEDPCVSRTTCHECIQAPSCGWCMQYRRESGYQPRCFQNLDSAHDCPLEYMYTPFNQLTVLKDFSSSTEGQEDTRIVNLKLRRHDHYALTMTYTKASSEQSTSEPTVTDNATMHVNITHDSKCLDQTCQNMEYKFLVELKECPSNPSQWKQSFVVSVKVGENVKKSLLVNFEMICSCACEQPGGPFYEEKSPRCSGHGKYKCGVCECDNEHFGNSCECSTNIKPLEYDGCRVPGSEDESSVCSGRGACICNQCECEIRENANEVITGNFCECDNFSCKHSGGEICGGGGHGSCICGKCACLPSWSGEACECSNATNTC